MDAMQQEDLPLARRQRIDYREQRAQALLELQRHGAVEVIAVLLGQRDLRLYILAPGTLGAAAVDCPVQRGPAQEGDRHADCLEWRLFQQLQANVMHDVAGKVLVRETPTNMFD